jgi:putative transposase
LEAVVTAKRDKAAALKPLKRIMKKYGQPRKIVTDRLRAYSAAMKAISNSDRQAIARRIRISGFDDESAPCSVFEA